jgi:alkyl hydroperoxide reductase subunit AhpC
LRGKKTRATVTKNTTTGKKTKRGKKQLDSLKNTNKRHRKQIIPKNRYEEEKKMIKT